MPETPDLKALAERYLDLWEEQFAAAAADPALAAAMAAWLGPWRALAAGARPGASGDMGRKSDDHAGKSRGETASAEPPHSVRPASAAAASRDGGRGLDRILEQLVRIERRLDALEQKRDGERKRSRRGGAGRGRIGRGRPGRSR